MLNIVFCIGKIIEDITFDFINDINYYSISKSVVETTEGFDKKNRIKSSKLNICAYNDKADKLYSSYEKGDYIYIIGYLEGNNVIITNFINY